jgi:hypothetical protein
MLRSIHRGTSAPIIYWYPFEPYPCWGPLKREEQVAQRKTNELAKQRLMETGTKKTAE